MRTRNIKELIRKSFNINGYLDLIIDDTPESQNDKFSKICSIIDIEDAHNYVFYSQLTNGAFILDDDCFSITWKYPNGKYLFNYDLKSDAVEEYDIGEIIDETEVIMNILGEIQIEDETLIDMYLGDLGDQLIFYELLSNEFENENKWKIFN